MVIQLTKSELALLERAALGKLLGGTATGATARCDLALLCEMQLVVQTGERFQITAIGLSVLAMGRSDPRRV